MKTLPQTSKSIYLFMLKWLPVLGTFLIQVHYLLLILGHRSIIADYIVDTSLFAWLFLYASSRLFFCKMHRALVWYIGAASLDVDLHHWAGLCVMPHWLIPVLMIFAAAILLTGVTIKRIQYHGPEDTV